MKKLVEFKVFEEYYQLLSKPNNAEYNGAAYVLNVEYGDKMFQELEKLSSYVKKNFKNSLFSHYIIKRKYSKSEISNTTLFLIRCRHTFEPSGEECGTNYDELSACEICGANRIQVGPLRLKKGTIPKKDISRTIAGEVIVSENFVVKFTTRGLKGLQFEQIHHKNNHLPYYQIKTSAPKLNISEKTDAGADIFDKGPDSYEATEFVVSGYTIRSEREVYRCPKGHLLGLNLISEAFVKKSNIISDFDFFESEEKIGVKRGLLRPEPLYFCSQAFRKMILEEKLTGFGFEVANVV